ncbi:MAG: TolC family protein [Bacteriovoracaceae bacterium]
MKIQVFAPFFLSLIVLPAFAYTLDDYLGEVKNKHKGFKALETSVAAKELRKDEAKLFFKPSFFLNGEYYDDQRPTNAPAFQGTQTLRHTLRSGLSQNLRLGTKATVSYNIYKTQINGTQGSFLPNKQFFDVAPQIEISQSLWRNFLGAEFEATEKAQLAQVEAARFADQFTYKQLLMQAENAYWRLYFAQTSLKVQAESLERAKRLRDWNAQRVKNNLTDEADLLQAEANLQSREIEYQDTLTEIAAALREFNSIRESEGEIDLHGKPEESAAGILEAEIPKKMKMREDVLAQLANQKLAMANAELGTQRNRPNLELYGSYSVNGRNSQYQEAYDQAMRTTRPFSIVGVRFTTPIDVWSMNDYKKAYAQEVTASELAYKRKMFEVEKEWEILVERFNNFKTRLRLSQKMVKVQERKLQNEKQRYNQGRTTTFQVLQFEQDFANAQLLKLRYERELLTVYNQIKLFTGNNYAN